MKAAKPGRAKSGKPGAIVPAIDHRQLQHELITQRGRATRLELVPLAARLREALRWRVTRLTPIVASPAYAALWRGDSRERRELMLDAIYESGDFHFGASKRELRQKLALWIHARLVATPSSTEAPAPS